MTSPWPGQSSDWQTTSPVVVVVRGGFGAGRVVVVGGVGDGGAHAPTSAAQKVTPTSQDRDVLTLRTPDHPPRR